MASLYYFFASMEILDNWKSYHRGWVMFLFQNSARSQHEPQFEFRNHFSHSFDLNVKSDLTQFKTVHHRSNNFFPFSDWVFQNQKCVLKFYNFLFLQFDLLTQRPNFLSHDLFVEINSSAISQIRRPRCPDQVTGV